MHSACIRIVTFFSFVDVGILLRESPLVCAFESFIREESSLFHLLLAAISTPLPAHIPQYTRQDAEEVSISLLSGINLPLAMDLTSSSGIARSLRASAYRPALRHAFQPRVAAPIITQRFASSGVGDGKIHQVIGAVVDGIAPIGP